MWRTPVNHRVIPLAEPRADLVLIGCFLVNRSLVTCIVDLEPRVVADVPRFAWPLRPLAIALATGS
jgi:hypothetical protein